MTRTPTAVVAALLTLAVASAPARAVPDPVEPYIEKYGRETCDALARNPTHDEVIKAITVVRDYVHLSAEDAEIVVVDSVWRLCPQYTNLIEPPGSTEPPPRPWG